MLHLQVALHRRSLQAQVQARLRCRPQPSAAGARASLQVDAWVRRPAVLLPPAARVPAQVQALIPAVQPAQMQALTLAAPP